MIYLNFVFLPVLALPALGLLDPGLTWLAVVPLCASGYGFCQERAKTEESFVGFPSYWNVLVLYLYVLAVAPVVSASFVVGLSILVFVPIHYIYPSKAKLLRRTTLAFESVWALTLMPLCLVPDASWAPVVAWGSMPFPLYYLVVSVVHHVRNHGRETAVTT